MGRNSKQNRKASLAWQADFPKGTQSASSSALQEDVTEKEKPSHETCHALQEKDQEIEALKAQLHEKDARLKQQKLQSDEHMKFLQDKLKQTQEQPGAKEILMGAQLRQAWVGLSAKDEQIEALEARLRSMEGLSKEREDLFAAILSKHGRLGVRWLWLSEHGWRAFEHRAQTLLEEQFTVDGKGKCTVESGQYFYEVDFEGMTQTNMRTGSRRSVMREGRSITTADFAQAVPEWVAHLEAQVDMLTEEKANLEVHIAQLQHSSAEVPEKIHAQHVALEKVVELWRMAPLSPPYLLRLPVEIHQDFRRILCRESHQAQSSRYLDSPFENFEVLSVKRIDNPKVWERYEHKRHSIKENLRGSASWKLPDTSYGFSELMPKVELMKEINEVLLLHGCSKEAAANIMEVGFDPRLAASRAKFGQGSYFAGRTDKADKYARVARDPGAVRHLLLSRVCLGEGSLVTGPYSGRLPPERPGKDRYNSIIVDPSRVSGQHWWEYVIFDGAQAYPECLIEYRML